MLTFFPETKYMSWKVSNYFSVPNAPSNWFEVSLWLCLQVAYTPCTGKTEHAASESKSSIWYDCDLLGIVERQKQRLWMESGLFSKAPSNFRTHKYNQGDMAHQFSGEGQHVSGSDTLNTVNTFRDWWFSEREGWKLWCVTLVKNRLNLLSISQLRGETKLQTLREMIIRRWYLAH